MGGVGLIQLCIVNSTSACEGPSCCPQAPRVSWINIIMDSVRREGGKEGREKRKGGEREGRRGREGGRGGQSHLFDPIWSSSLSWITFTTSKLQNMKQNSSCNELHNIPLAI